ncbi:MAG: hypothetical protein Q9184_006717 [Pyrenodesmia sp. 2 TL-2023]
MKLYMAIMIRSETFVSDVHWGLVERAVPASLSSSMAFTKEDDPYPPSLPEMGSPYTSSADHFFGPTYPAGGATSDFDTLEAINFFNDAVQLPHGEYGATIQPVNRCYDRPHSPPSTSTSSSNSSVQHQRHASSNSSRSATFESQAMVPAEAQMHRLRLGNSNAKITESPKRTLEAMKTENDLDRQMNELFDFDSAANSPGDSISTGISFDKPIAGVAMPQQEDSLLDTARPILQPYNQRRLVTDRSVVSTPSSFKPESSWEYPSAQGQPFGFTGDPRFQGNVSHNPFFNPPSAPALLGCAGFVGTNSFGYPQPTFVPPEATYIAPGGFARPVGPVLFVHDIPPKTRVETQIPITMTLMPMPPGMTRLHLPTRTMAKPKLIAKPHPTKSPDMLELDVMPVCASAMKRQDAYLRAFAIARGEDISAYTRHRIQRSSSDGPDTQQNPGGKVDPMEGGTISICDGCMMRERKRANRRMEKEATDEDISWRQGEKERIVVFNENEVVDWKPYGSADLNEPASKRARGTKGKKKECQPGEDKSTSNPPCGFDIQNCEMARQGEAEGFQVILTLKNHLGNCIAQHISTPILITDDHKTSALQNDGGSPRTAVVTHMPPTQSAPDRSQTPSTSPDSSSAADDGLSMGPAAVSAQAQTRDTIVDRDASRRAHPSTSGPVAGVTASHQSDAQSPQPIHTQPNADLTAHAQALHHSLLHVPGAVAPAVVAPRVSRVIPSEGPQSGGIEVSVIGEGFRPGLDVLFSDAVATQTTVYNSQLLVCVIPPSSQAAIVRVTLRGHHQIEPHTWFRYTDCDKEELMALALKVLHHRRTGRVANPSHIAQSILDGQSSKEGQQSLSGAQHPQGFGLRSIDLELSVLGVIDLIDQADSIIAPRFSARQFNGQTMLHIAASLGYHRLVAGLLARGVNPDFRDRNGMAAMHLACLRGHTKVVRKLLSAGGDPTLRSLLGLAPIDMATSQEVYQLMGAIAHHTRSRSIGATPVSQLSRASSVTSVHSMWGTETEDQTLLDRINLPYSSTMAEAYRSRPVTPAEAWARSRRNSASDKQCFLQDQSTDDPTANTHLLAAAAAMAAWRDNLAGQIQHFQQSVQRTLPNLQIPNLPQVPNFEGYQEHPMVRRISSLVPRMNSPPAPPAYDEIYPDAAESDADVKKASAARAAGDAFMDDKCATSFDQTQASSSSLIRAMSVAGTKDQREALRLFRAGKVKKLSNDRKLFFIWIPLLVLVVIAMIKDWAPQILRGAQQGFTSMQDYLES